MQSACQIEEKVMVPVRIQFPKTVGYSAVFVSVTKLIDQIVVIAAHPADKFQARPRRN